jgi:hypothetical protein
VLAGVERFIVEFFRAKGDIVGPLTSAQWSRSAVAASAPSCSPHDGSAAPLAVAR